MEYYSAIKKNEIMPFAATWDGLGDYHTKWSKSDRERQKSCDITYMQNLKKWYKWTYLPDRNRLTDLENEFMTTKWGRVGVRDRLGVCNAHIHTAIFKIDNQQGPTV